MMEVNSIKKRRQAGMTLVELIVAFTILSLLASMAVPLARYKVKRDKERDLRWALHDIHQAIDKYKDMADRGELGPQKLGSENYPETLEILVQGAKKAGAVDTKVKFLRRIPKDPITNSYDWGKRSMQDDTTSTSWGGQNVFDVYTKSRDKASDGTNYTDW